MRFVKPTKEENLIIIILLSISFGLCIGVMAKWGHCNNPDHYTLEEAEMIVLEMMQEAERRKKENHEKNPKEKNPKS